MHLSAGRVTACARLRFAWPGMGIEEDRLDLDVGRSDAALEQQSALVACGGEWEDDDAGVGGKWGSGVDVVRSAVAGLLRLAVLRWLAAVVSRLRFV